MELSKEKGKEVKNAIGYAPAITLLRKPVQFKRVKGWGQSPIRRLKSVSKGGGEKKRDEKVEHVKPSHEGESQKRGRKGGISCSMWKGGKRIGKGGAKKWYAGTPRRESSVERGEMRSRERALYQERRHCPRGDPSSKTA